MLAASTTSRDQRPKASSRIRPTSSERRIYRCVEAGKETNSLISANVIAPSAGLACVPIAFPHRLTAEVKPVPVTRGLTDPRPQQGSKHDWCCNAISETQKSVFETKLRAFHHNRVNFVTGSAPIALTLPLGLLIISGRGRGLAMSRLGDRRRIGAREAFVEPDLQLGLLMTGVAGQRLLVRRIMGLTHPRRRWRVRQIDMSVIRGPVSIGVHRNSPSRDSTSGTGSAFRRGASAGICR